MTGRKHERLSALQVRKISEPGYYADGDGLYLQVSPTLSKSWILRYQLQKRSREMGLGPARLIGLSEAREAARRYRRMLLDKRDPIEARDVEHEDARRRQASRQTFKQCAERYIATQEPGWKNAKHAAQWKSTLEQHVYPIFGATDVSKVDRALVLRALAPIWPTITDTASKVRGRIESVLDWAKANGYREGDNPAAWKGNLEADLPAKSKVAKTKHHPALPYRQSALFLRRIRATEGLASRALEFTILTAARTVEVIQAQWTEIDFAEKTWIVPAERMKAKKQHRVPLSRAALEILKSLPRSSVYIFPGRRPEKPMSNMAMANVLKRLNREDITVHGFRSTFRDWAGETTRHAREVIEHALAHQLEDEAEAAYQRGDLLQKRRVLMSDWAKYCDGARAR